MSYCKVPCKDCQNRKIPKTCESTCEKWINYKKEKNKEKELYIQAKLIEKEINKQTRRENYEIY